MLHLIRTIGYLLIGIAALTLLTYLIKPLHALWPLFLKLPLPIQISITAATLGTLILITTIIWERLQTRSQDNQLEDKI